MPAEFRDTATLLLALGAALLVWLPMLYAFIWARVFSVRPKLRFSLLSTFITYGSAFALSATFSFPAIVLLTKLLPYACENNASGWLCHSIPLFAALESHAHLAFVTIAVLISPYVTQRYFWKE